MSFANPPPTLLPALDPHMSAHGLSNGLSDALSPYEEAPMYTDLEIDASLEYTGIAPEEVQRYISEQDPKTNKWMCLYQDCGKVFGRRENIRSHVQTHLGDRQFKCNGCGKCFVRQHDLKRHAKIHTGNKPYKCPCGAGFARQDALTRHRQRGMCVGGFADAVRRQAKRGRPKKQRPEMEDRMEKANRTRRALVSASSSVSASSPCSDAAYEAYEPTRSQMLSESGSFNEPMNSSTDPFSFETTSSPYAEETNEASYTLTTTYTGEVASMNLLQQLSEDSHTPPLSPADCRPRSRDSGHARRQSSPLKITDSPSRSSVQSHQFTTPPSSPVETKDVLEDLFDIRPEASSQFDLEMKAMGDFTLSDPSSYDFLDFAAV
jgi:regulatory protein SWI5